MTVAALPRQPVQSVEPLVGQPLIAVDRLSVEFRTRDGVVRAVNDGCCNVFGFSDPEVEKTIAAAQREFDLGQQDALLSKAMGLVSAASPALYVVHDLNLRVLAPQVKGFVQPQSWYADFTNITVTA